MSTSTVAIDDPDYQIIDAMTLCSKPSLIDCQGFTMGKTYKTSKGCSIYNNTIECRGCITQVGETFTRGPHNHLHAGDPSAEATTWIYKAAKVKAVDNLFNPVL